MIDVGLRDYWIHYLRRQPHALYAVLDAARAPRALSLGRRLGGSLFDGDEAEALQDVAPYLVALAPSHWLVQELIAEAWGNAWGVFLTSRAPLLHVRAHLQRLMHVETDRGARLFRFYDPRVLRAFVPACTSDELDELFGPIERFIVESRTPTWAWEFSRDVHAQIGVAA
ncbi:MAG TPA: DUF4123 domain-containing protein [Kofleriaceae bacterium]|jgi:hypothetical protein|nr:DUF4123 domain-containing protein [Kofleriaceae bacterium]